MARVTRMPGQWVGTHQAQKKKKKGTKGSRSKDMVESDSKFRPASREFESKRVNPALNISTQQQTSCSI